MSASFYEYLRTIQMGESILIEYKPTEPLHMIFNKVLEYAKQNNSKILIIDILDTFHVIKEHLKTCNLDTETLDKLDVIKGGGIINVGHVLKKIDISKEPPIYISEFAKFLEEYYRQNKNVVVVILGADKLTRVYLTEVPTLEMNIGLLLKKFLGNPSRVAIWFVNTGMVPQKLLIEWEEISTRVLEIALKGKKQFVIKIKKSIKIEDHGKEFIVSAEEVLYSEV
ncbi:MAG: DUF257 family protein [Thermococcus sp.]|uniref:DUF257 family protein n=1 Tax=Thermococcus sp. TaxID=35749 RepID=UPI001E12304E|nr:DUF257 family protein [Thermococcus sp.]MBO8174748.1 DUF257 family protein [Thermococcus sp.]